jgi:hypothetical protein
MPASLRADDAKGSTNTNTSPSTSSTAAATPSPPPPHLAHLYNNPHVLFPEPLLPCLSSRGDWVVQTSFVGDTMAEFTLTAGKLPSSSPTSTSSSSASSAASPPSPSAALQALAGGEKPGPPKYVDMLTYLAAPRKSKLLRILLTLFIAAALLVLFPVSPPLLIPYPPLENALNVVQGWTWPPLRDAILRIVAAAVVAAIMTPRSVVQESVACVRGLGVQVTTVFDDGSREVCFIDAASVKGIVINEGMRTCKVRYYLAVVAAGRRSMVLLFSHAQPRLPVIAHMYAHLTRVMTGPPLEER